MRPFAPTRLGARALLERIVRISPMLPRPEDATQAAHR
jgi:hypothetical protein